MPETHSLPLGPDRSLHFVQAGSGPDLVLIHGALTDHRDWLDGPFEQLAKRYRVTALDRPGHGGSARRRFEGAPREQAWQIGAGLRAAGINRAVFVGHSLGGLVALALAEMEPDLVRALVLVAPITHPEPRLLEHLALAPRAAPLFGPALSRLSGGIDPLLLKGMRTMMFAPQKVPDDWLALYPGDAIRNAENLVHEGEDAAAILPGVPGALVNASAIRCPVTVVTGKADQIVAHDRHAERLARQMKARLVALEGVGHMAHRVATDAVLAAIYETAEGVFQS